MCTLIFTLLKKPVFKIPQENRASLSVIEAIISTLNKKPHFSMLSNNFLNFHSATALLQNPINHHQMSTTATVQAVQPAIPSILTPTPAPQPLMNGGLLNTPAASLAQPTPLMSTGILARNQPIPEEQLTTDQSRIKQGLMDHKAAGEGNLEREEKLEISGKDARYMMMQKLARQQTAVSNSC